MRKAELHSLLRVLAESGEGITDLNLTAGKPPQVVKEGELAFPLVDPPLPELTPFMTEQIALNLLQNRPKLIRDLTESGSCDFAYTLPGVARFRVNVFSQRGSFSIVLRRLATKMPTMHDLFLPRIFADMVTLNDGLVLITGGSGSGKTTTMSSLVHEINMSQAVHIVTLEDPIEFLHSHQVGTVNQREFGLDFDTFPSGMRAALRQGPRVIVVGELRDRETIEMALCAAESGHLVLSTMRTINASQTMQTIVGMFALVEQDRIRQRLAECLRYCVAQTLVPKLDGGRIPALEIMVGNYRMQDLIRIGESDDKSFYRFISEGRTAGMQTADAHLVQLLQDGLISEETARNYTSDRIEVVHMIDRVQAGGSEEGQAKRRSTGSDEAELKMDYTYGKTPRE